MIPAGPGRSFFWTCVNLLRQSAFHSHTLRTYGALIIERALVMPSLAQTTTNAAWALPGKVYAFSIRRV